jgi:ADP-heptose:LPS heptosyltransferase/GT2 family glycosyltransferase
MDKADALPAIEAETSAAVESLLSQGDAPASGRQPMVLVVDSVSLDVFGTLEVSGWVLSLTPIVAVQVFIDEQHIGPAVHGLARDDVGSRHGDYPHADRSGFHFFANVAGLASSKSEVRVEAIGLGGISRDVSAPILAGAAAAPPSSVAEPGADLPEVETSSIRFQLDDLLLTTDGSLMVAGWTFADSEIDAVQIRFDGDDVGDAEIGLPRPDVARHYSSMPSAAHAGFAFRKSLEAQFDGEHLVTVIVIAADGEARSFDLPVQAVAPPALPGEAQGPADDPTLKLFIDRPEISGDRAAGVVQGGLIIEGWALAREGVEAIEIFLDGDHIDTARYGERREDIAVAFPDWEGALLSGFGAFVPPRALGNGRHGVRVELRTTTGRAVARSFEIDVEQRLRSDGPWALRRKMTATEIAVTERVLDGLNWHPQCVMLMRVDDLAENNTLIWPTLISIREQAYRKWHVVIVVRQAVPAKPLVEEFDDIADRVHFIADTGASPLAELISRAVGQRPDLVIPISAGDVLGCDALLELATATGLHPEAELVYADERRVNPDSGQIEAFFKPDWSPELLLGTNYIGRLWCADALLFQRLGATAQEWREAGDYDLVLRATEIARDIHHIPKVIAERASAHLDDPELEGRALDRMIHRRRIDGRVSDGCAPGYYRVQRDVATKGLVSIIIPTCAARGLIQTCIETLRAKTAYRNIEIVCIENIPDSENHWRDWLRRNADKVVRAREPFNWSRFNNLAAEVATGEFLLFLNDDIEIVEPGWLDALLEYAQQPEVGVVGARLLYPDRKIQHAGMFWSAGHGRHAFRFASDQELGYFGLAQSVRNVISVTGACLLVRRAEFDAVRGFDEKHNIVNNDVDFCLRVQERGKRIVITPFATLIHHELASRAAIPDEFDNAEFEGRWGAQLEAGDPFHHPLLVRQREDFSPDTEPLELVYAGHPLFMTDDIRKILVVKLDHIGDFILAVPAIRQLKADFPAATITVLGPPSVSSFLPLVPEISEIVTFEFFHARSGLGQKSLSSDELTALHHRLVLQHFDLAIDLRKAPETRPILQYTGARWLAGFDYDGQFPWLDVAVEWEKDRGRVRKRSHIGDDLLLLVGSVKGATRSDREVLPQPAAGAAPITHKLSGRRFVCIHPGVGSPTRQWPAEHYAALIDLLVVGHQVAIAVIGGPDEAEIADQVIEMVQHRDAVESFVGKIRLGELPFLLAPAALYVGNNSGPKHIAAGLGVPTIGIHSGAVDAREWAPIGPMAVAVRRDVHCSPCYLASVASCPRALACLVELRPPEVYEICSRLLAIDSQR